ncbi:MAG: glycosyltransferase [Verrucomicrobiae bacterium]|nr:glycosyltransferase [Verrucomicrobiae bacterium]
MAAKSKASLNISLNGDFNLRIFEVTQNGALLFTDLLSPFSGLYHFFRDGETMVSYETELELISKIRYYSEHPEIAAQIAASGKAVTCSQFDLKARRSEFFNLLNGSTSTNAFKLSDEPRCQIRSSSPENKNATLRRIQIYEIIQEIHRTCENPNVVLTSQVSPFVATDLADLPRLNQFYATDAARYGEMIHPIATRMKVENLSRIEPYLLEKQAIDTLITTQKELTDLLPTFQSAHPNICVWDYHKNNQILVEMMKDHGYQHSSEDSPGLFVTRAWSKSSHHPSTIKSKTEDMASLQGLLHTGC